MNEPRNVTPGVQQHSSPEWSAWNWSQRGWNFPWLGLLLVLVGVGLLIQFYVPGLTAGTLVLTALAIVLLAAWLFGRSRWAVVPTLLILALGLSGLARELNIYSGPGLTALALAAAFALICVLDYARGVRSSWPLWGAAIFGLIGFVQVSGKLVAIPELGALWPVLIIIVGVLLLISARRQGTPRI